MYKQRVSILKRTQTAVILKIETSLLIIIVKLKNRADYTEWSLSNNLEGQGNVLQR
jgi:hypothetical protein